MTARQEKVREALLVMLPKGYHDELGNSLTEHKALAALAEVEEWEAAVAAMIESMGKSSARLAAAEAEADRLKAALTELRDAHELLKASRAKDMYDARLDALSRKAHGDPYPEIP